MFVLRKSPEGDAERSNFDRSASPASYESATLSSLFILVGGDTDDCLIKEIPAEGFGGRRHAAHALCVPSTFTPHLPPFPPSPEVAPVADFGHIHIDFPDGRGLVRVLVTG
jgi:hypothetical protein